MSYVIRKTTGGRFLVQNANKELHINQYPSLRAAETARERLRQGLVQFISNGKLIEVD